MDENNMTAAGQTAPAAAQTEAPAEAAEQTVTVGALRGAIERRQEQNMRRAAEQTAARWSREADELTAQCPGFDLGAALKDDRFCALLRAGIDVRTAWFALHAQALDIRADLSGFDDLLMHLVYTKKYAGHPR